MRWQHDQPVPGFDERRVARLNLATGGPEGAPAVVLVHGLGCTWRFWRPLLAPLVDAGLRVVAVDAPGFGTSDTLPGAGYDLGLAADRIAEALAKLDLARVSLVGHSFGGGLAGRTTVDHPALVDRLALLAPAGFVLGEVRESWRHPTRARIGNLVQRTALPVIAVSAALRASIFSRFVHDSRSLELRDAFQLGYDATTSRQGNEAGIAIVEQGLVARAHEIAVPTLVQWGDADRVVGYRYAAEITAAIPGARLRTYADAGHALPYEAGALEAVTRDLLDVARGGQGAGTATGGCGPT